MQAVGIFRTISVRDRFAMLANDVHPINGIPRFPVDISENLEIRERVITGSQKP